MNRPIKFRGWHSINKKMIYPHLTPYNFGGIFSHDILKMYETVMQFTGVHDKKGVEIYEGDIIKGGKRKMQVIFKQEACQFWLIFTDSNGVNRYEPLRPTYGDDEGYFSNVGLRVIGNIYQNPELL